MNKEIIKKAEKLYAEDGGLAKRLRQGDEEADMLKYVRKGLDGYVDPQFKREPEEIAKKIEQESSGLVDYRTMLTVIINFIKKASEIYEHYQKSEYGSRRGFATSLGMDWTYFEDFYWRNNLGERKGSTKKLPRLKKKIEKLEQKLAA